MKFVLIPRKKIDCLRWDKVIKASPYKRIYALSWYLDAVSPSWKAIIGGDYEFILPVPLSYKWNFIPWVCQPPLCQQLAAYGDVKPDYLQQVFHKLQFYPKIRLTFPAHQWQELNMNFSNYTLLQNSLLPLQTPYLELRKKYATLRKRELKKAQSLPFQIQCMGLNPSWKTYIIQTQASKLYLSGKGLGRLNNLLDTLWQQERLRLYVSTFENKPAGYVVLAIDFERIIYLIAYSEKPYVATLLIDRIIQDFAEKVQWLDFEGSSLPNVQRFYQSWGNLTFETYYLWKGFRSFINFG